MDFFQNSHLKWGIHVVSRETVIFPGQTMNQQHTPFVAWAKDNSFPALDGLLGLRGESLAVKTADCLPILLFSSQENWIAAIHGGWRSLSLGILDNLYSELTKKQFHLSSAKAIFGPHIIKSCFEVEKEVVTAFEESNFSLDNESFSQGSKQGKFLLSLSALASKKLQQWGMHKNHIYDLNLCSHCLTPWPSHRREGRQRTHQIVSWISLETT